MKIGHAEAVQVQNETIEDVVDIDLLSIEERDRLFSIFPFFFSKVCFYLFLSILFFFLVDDDDERTKK